MFFPALAIAALLLAGGDLAAERESLAAATPFYERALDIALESGDAALISRAYEKLDSTYTLQGRHDRSLDLANRMLARQSPSDANRALYLVLRGSAYSNLNDPASAQRDFEQALPLAEASGDPKTIAIVHRFRGLWLWRFQRDLAATMHEYDQALAFATRAKAWSLVVMTENAYGNPFRDRDHRNFGEALKHYETGLAIARREHLEARVPYFLKNIGDVYRQEGDAARAEPPMREAIDIADRYDVQEVRWMARSGLARLLAQRDPAGAERYFNEALDLLEAQQEGVLLDDLRPGVLADQLRFDDPYDGAIEFLLSQNRTADAFTVAERKRARVFLEVLAGARERIRATLPPGFIDSERQIRGRLRAAQAKLRNGGTSEAERAALLSAVDRAETEMTELQLRLALERPSVAHVRYPKLWRVADLQSHLLAGDEAILAVHAGRDRSVAWVITRERLMTIALPPRAEIERAAKRAINDLRNPYAHEGNGIADLSRVLHVTEFARAGKPRLIVIPDGLLYDVPFEALVDDGGHPLVERFAVSYAPSASSLAILRSSSPQRSGGTTLVAVANPVVARRSPSPQRQTDLASLASLAPLPSTADEVHRIAGLFGRSAIVLEGSNARRAELQRRGVQDAHILHFATHGLIDERRPLRSGLLLTADPPRDDGLLQMRDIYAMHVNADLVTLSACESALGENVTGEGMIGLTRAFFFAGARSVAASLWNVDDTATAQFMERFYANIQRGQPIDAALQQTKISFLRDGGATASPFFWAAFVVSGNARTTIDAPKPFPIGTAAIAVLAVLALLAYWRTMKVRRAEVATALP